MLGEQQVAVVMEVADDGDSDVGHDRGDRARRFIGVHGHAHQFAAGLVQSAHLRSGRGGIGSVGVGHRLDDDRMGTAHQYAAHADGDCRASGTHGQEI